MFKNIKVWLCCIILILACGCASTNISNSNSKIKLVISKDYAKTVISEEAVSIKPDFSVMEILKTIKDVKTDKSGSYIVGIDKLEEKLADDKASGNSWFLYVNGKSSNVGAKDYYPQSGETIILDYHKWSMTEPYLDTIDLKE